MNKHEEYQYIISFLNRDAYVSNPLYKSQLRALWTAYCLHNKMSSDTDDYNSELYRIWAAMFGKDNVFVFEGGKQTVRKAFDLFMGELLS